MGASKCDLSCAKAATNWDAAQTRRPRSEISARVLQEGFHLRPPPGAKLAVDLPFDLSLEPLKPASKPRHHLGGKILKLLKLQLTRKPKSAPPPQLPVQDFHRPALRVLHFQDLITQSTQFPTLDDVTRRYNYEDALETSSRTSNSGSSEAESTRSSAGSHLSNSQLMANILLSIMDEEDPASEDSPGDVQTGPHESAWHQPLDETNLVDSPTLRARQSATASMKHSRGGPRSSAVSADGLYTSPGPSRRYGKLDLSKIEVHKIR